MNELEKRLAVEIRAVVIFIEIRLPLRLFSAHIFQEISSLFQIIHYKVEVMFDLCVCSW